MRIIFWGEERLDTQLIGQKIKVTSYLNDHNQGTVAAKFPL